MGVGEARDARGRQHEIRIVTLERLFSDRLQLFGYRRTSDVE